MAAKRGASRPAAFERGRRALGAVDGRRGRIAPRGRARAGGARIDGTGLSHGCGEARERGPSKREARIAAAIDARESPVAKARGHGKPSAKRMRGAPLGRPAPESPVERGEGKPRPGPMKAAKRAGSACQAGVSDPLRAEATAMASSLRPRPKRRLWRFAGMGPGEPAVASRSARLPA